MFLGKSCLLANRFPLVDVIVLCSLLLSTRVARISAEIPDHDAIRKILHNPNLNITYDLLRGYFDMNTGLESAKLDHSRLFPLCIRTSTLEKYSPLNDFAPIWKEMESQGDCEVRPLWFHEYNSSLHSTLNNNEWIESITMSRINTPEVDVRNMRQWMHIKVKTKTPLRALYMQSIVGSMGLPSGEFSLEFPCSDIPGGDTSAQDSMIFHCDFRPRTGLNHPVAFFGGYTGAKQMTEFHVHYKWSDISCLETPFLQFMMIAIKDFQRGTAEGPKMGIDFQPLFSPVYTNMEFDSRDGIMTPYYIDWKDEMTCDKTSHATSWMKSTKLYHDSEFEALQWKETTLERLIPNEEYDDCLLNSTDSERDDKHNECGPGPLACPEELSLKTVNDQAGFQEIVDRRQAEFDQFPGLLGCLPCIFPREEDIMRLSCASARLHFGDDMTKYRSVQVDTFLYLDYSEFVNSQVDGRYHGAIAIFVYFVITPLGVFLARFYRGTPVHHMHRDDFWMMVHGIIHLLGMHLLWISVGFVTTMDEGLSHTAEHCFRQAEQIMLNSTNWTQELYLEWLHTCTHNSRTHSHAVIGIFSMVIHNLNVIMAFFRSHTDYIRNIQVAIHSHLGYLDMAVSLLTIYFAVRGQHCTEMLTYTIIMLVITVLAFMSAAGVTSSEDAEMGVDPPRYRWPILEPIRLAHAGPKYEAKMAIVGIYAAVLLFIWMLCVVSLSRLTSSETTAYAGGDSATSIHGIFTTCSVPNLFKPQLKEDA